jgi:HAD superfamily hydrolase (TIGR01549 family)
MSSKIKFICYDWGGTLEYSGTRNIFLHSKNLNYKLSTLKNDVISTLSTLKNNGINMGIITNTDKCNKCMIRALNETGLNKYFNFVLFSNSVGSCKKPCEDIFKKAIDKIHIIDPYIKPENILYVGNDYIKDVLGANNVGISSAFLVENDIMKKFALKFGKQNYILENVSDLTSLI